MRKKYVCCSGLLFLVLIGATPVFSQASSGDAVLTYVEHVEPIISSRCYICHGSDSPSMEEYDTDKEGFMSRLKGPRWDSYENLMVVVNGEDTGALMRRLDDGNHTADGKPGNMHMYLGASAEERTANLRIIKEWVGIWKLDRRPEWTESDMMAVKALEK